MFLIVPLKLSFFLFDDEPVLFFNIGDRVLKCLLFIDIVLKFFIPRYYYYELETKHSEILKLRLKSLWFYIDCYSAIPWEDLFFTLFRLERTLTLATIVHLSTLSALVTESDLVQVLRPDSGLPGREPQELPLEVHQGPHEQQR